MLLTLKRMQDGDTQATTGDLWGEGQEHWFTLEPANPIPSGIYEVRITPSPKFKRPLPLLIDVPGHDGIRIHSGNTAKDTEDCILVGTELVGDFVAHSVDAFEQFFAFLQDALSKGPVYIDVGYA